MHGSQFRREALSLATRSPEESPSPRTPATQVLTSGIPPVTAVPVLRLHTYCPKREREEGLQLRRGISHNQTDHHVQMRPPRA
jgi:hypothetical protein